MMLFGSYARGEYRSDSDIDIAVILEDSICLLRDRAHRWYSFRIISEIWYPDISCSYQRKRLGKKEDDSDLKYWTRWNGNMNEEIKALLKMAADSIKGARLLFDEFFKTPGCSGCIWSAFCEDRDIQAYVSSVSWKNQIILQTNENCPIFITL